MGLDVVWSRSSACPTYAEPAAEDANARLEFATTRSGRLVGLVSIRIKELKILSVGLAYAYRAPLILMKVTRPATSNIPSTA
jgi:hypothetical protein